MAIAPQIISQHVDITPHLSLLGKVGQSGHSVAEAVAELVDNAVDARRQGRVSIDVDYDAKDGWLRIRDDGHGMNRRELADALVLGLSSKQGNTIGRFGLGLKTAATSLGTRFRVTTVREDAQYEWIADYDEDTFLAAGRWELPIRRQAKRRQVGTDIKVWSDRVYPALHQSLDRNLGWTFRHFLRDGVLELSINGQPVEPSGYEVDPESVMPFEGHVAGKHVHGWAALLIKSSQRGWYGFSLVRHRRIVRRHEKLGFQPHPSTARVVGELHLDEFDTNNLKTDFIRETASWRELETWVSDTIEPVLAASRRLAHAGMLDLRIRSAIEDGRTRLLDTEDPNAATELAGGRRMMRDDDDGPRVAVAVGPLHLEHRWVWKAQEDDYYAVERRARPGDSDLLVVASNLAHPLSSLATDAGAWACHNIAEAAAHSLGTPAEFTALKGVILSKLLDERPLRRALLSRAPETPEITALRSLQ